MSPEEKALLERTYRMVEENNEILKSIRRSSRWSLFLRISYWVVIIGLSYGAYYFIQPYIEALLGVYGQVQDNANGITSLMSLTGLLK